VGGLSPAPSFDVTMTSMCLRCPSSPGTVELCTCTLSRVLISVIQFHCTATTAYIIFDCNWPWPHLFTLVTLPEASTARGNTDFHTQETKGSRQSIVSGSLYRRTHSLSRLAWSWLAATWRHSTFIKWTGWTLAMALPWWQHHKHCLGYYYYYYYYYLLSAMCISRRQPQNLNTRSPLWPLQRCM